MRTLEKAAIVAGVLMAVATAGLLMYEKPVPPKVAPPPFVEDTTYVDEKVVPYVATPSHVVDSMLSMARIQKGDVLYDLGSGDGRIVITAAKRYGIKAVGYEVDEQLVKSSRDSIQKEGLDSLAEIRQESFYRADLSKATVLTLYLLQHLNLELRPVIRKQMKPGSRVVSHLFHMGD